MKSSVCRLTAIPGVYTHIDQNKLLLNESIFQRLTTLLKKGNDKEYYQTKSQQEVIECLGLIDAIIKENSGKLPERIFSLVATILAFRSLPLGFKVPMCVRVNANWQIEECVLEQYVECAGGVRARLFIPKQGSPVCLFHGTLLMGAANGARMTLLDDFNPLGIGHWIGRGAAKNLRQHLVNSKEKAIVIGQSLGGVLAVRLAVDCPDLISDAYCFSPPRVPFDVAARYLALPDEKKPRISTFIPSYLGKEDWITFLGDKWIGELYRVNAPYHADVAVRHIYPTLQLSDTHLEQVDTKKINRHWMRSSYLFTAVQRICAFVLWIVFVPFYLISRLTRSLR